MVFSSTVKRLCIASGIACATALLSACNGGGGTTADILGTSNAEVRFLNGSSGAGNVDVFIDGSNKFSATAVNTITNYISIGTGTHSVTIYPAGNDTQSAAILSNQTFSVNSANYETLALGGAVPSTLYKFSDQVFTGTYNGYGAVNFYNASPAAGATGIQFGYYTNPQSTATNPTINALGSVIAPSSESNPIGVPTSVAIGFGAATPGSTTAIATLTPSQIDSSGCAANTFACNTGLVSIFLIDGPKLVGIFNSTGQ